MRIRSAFSEAIKNVATRTSRPILSFILFFLVVGALSLYDLGSIKTVLTDFRNFQTAGASIHTVNAPGEIDARSCELLAILPGVRAAGAITEGEPIRFSVTPSSRVPMQVVSPGFVELLSNRSNTRKAGIYVSAEVAMVLGASPGDAVSVIQGEPVYIEGVFDYPDDGRRPGLGWAVLEVQPASPGFDECWIDIPQPSAGAADYLLTAVASSSETKPKLGQLNTTLGTEYDGRAKFQARPSQVALQAALIFGVILGFTSKRLRRLELASALHVGVSKWALTIQVLVEEAVWLSPAVLLLTSVYLWQLQTALVTDHLALFLVGAKIFGLASCGVLLGAVIGVAGTREKHLFRYFKDR